MIKKERDLEENNFVDMLLKIGINQKCRTHEGRNCYYCFWLADGQQRHWMNLSVENEKRVGF